MSNPIHRRSVDRFMAMADGREEVSVLASEYDALESENEALRSQLTDALNRQTCEGGQPYVCHTLATARSRLAEAEALLRVVPGYGLSAYEKERWEKARNAFLASDSA